jgi:hypothetical protein
MKINFGVKQNASPRSVLGFINDVTNDKSISISNIEISNKFTFFDVFADQADHLLNTFNKKNRTSFAIAIAKEGKRRRNLDEVDFRENRSNFHDNNRKKNSRHKKRKYRS